MFDVVRNAAIAAAVTIGAHAAMCRMEGGGRARERAREADDRASARPGAIRDGVVPDGVDTAAERREEACRASFGGVSGDPTPPGGELREMFDFASNDHTWRVCDVDLGESGAGRRPRDRRAGPEECAPGAPSYAAVGSYEGEGVHNGGRDGAGVCAFSGWSAAAEFGGALPCSELPERA